MTATTPGTASNSESRKRLAEQAAATCPTVIHVGAHAPHWDDPAVVQLIEQARAEGAAEVVARVEALADEFRKEGNRETARGSYPKGVALRYAANRLMAAARWGLRGDAR